MAGPAEAARLPRVGTRRQFMDVLEGWISRAGEGGADPRAGRPAGLKSYVLESDGPLRRNAALKRINWSMADTGVAGLKIASVTLDGGARRQFFADVSDRRFITVHTNGRERDVGPAIDALTDGYDGMFDRMWVCHGMLEHIAKKGGGLAGFDMRHAGGLPAGAGPRRGAPAPGGQRIGAGGPMAGPLLDLVKSDGRLWDALALRSIRVARGAAGGRGCAHVDISGTGRFAARRGASAQGRLDIVGESKEMYSRAMAGVEKCRLGAVRRRGRAVVTGKALNFALPKRTADAGPLAGALSGPRGPFRLGGFKSVVEPGYYRVLAVDLHTGIPSHSRLHAA